MKNFRNILTGFFIFAVFGLHAFAEHVKLSRYFVPIKDKSTIERIADRFEIIKRRTLGFEVIVPADRTRHLRQLAPDAILLESDLDQYFINLDEKEPEWLADYHSFDQVQQQISEIAEEHPDIASTEIIGHSKRGKPITVLRLGARSNTPEILLTSATHGDELITVEVLLGIIHALADGYGKNERLTRILENHQIYFIPVVNPDGFLARHRYDNGFDPNRQFPYPDLPQRYPLGVVHPLVTFFEKHSFVGSIDFHAYSKFIFYPWSYTDKSIISEDLQRFHNLTGRMVSTNGYKNGSAAELMYIAKGTSADYYYWKKKTVALGVEIGKSKAPHSKEIPQLIREHLESTWIFIESF